MEIIKIRMQTQQATEDANGADDSLRHSRRRQHRQLMQTEQVTEDVDGVDNTPRHSKCKRHR